MIVFAYSPASNGLLRSDINSEFPKDAKEISEERYYQILAETSSGLLLMPDQSGNPVTRAVVLTIQQEKQIYADGIQDRLDAVAREHGYDDIKTAVTYAEEPAVPKFQNDGKAFRAWRSLVWAYVYQQLDLVESGKRQKPTIEQLLSELPVLTGV